MADAPILRQRVLFAGPPSAIETASQRLLCGRYEIERCPADELSLLGRVEVFRPDVVIVDLQHLSSLKTIGRILERARSCQVLALTGMPQLSIRAAVFAAGGTGVIVRSEPATEIARWIDAVLSGRPSTRCLPPGAETNARENPIRPAPRLTDADRLVLSLVARSYPAHRIARVLGLSTGAVRLSLAYLKRQLRVCTRQELKRYAGNQRLISDIP